MGWKGTLRAIETEIRRSAREAERRRKHTAKIQSLEDADNAVRAFEEYIQKITSVHKSRTTEVIDWKQGPPSELEFKEEVKLIFTSFFYLTLHESFIELLI